MSPRSVRKRRGGGGGDATAGVDDAGDGESKTGSGGPGSETSASPAPSGAQHPTATAAALAALPDDEFLMRSLPFWHPGPRSLSLFDYVALVFSVLVLAPVRVCLFVVCWLLMGAGAAVAGLGAPRMPDGRIDLGTGLRSSLFSVVLRLSARGLILSWGVWKLNVVGRRNPRVHTIVANHVSFVDIAAAAAVANPSFVSRATVRSVPVLGFTTAVAGGLFVDPDSKAPWKAQTASASRAGGATDALLVQQRRLAERIARADRGELERVQPLLLFPEGTTTNGHAITSFRSGAFRGGYTVQPMVVRSSAAPWCPTWESVPLPLHVFHLFTGRWTSITIEWLPPMTPTPEQQRDPQLFAQAVRTAMAAAASVPEIDVDRSVKLETHRRMRSAGRSWWWWDPCNAPWHKLLLERCGAATPWEALDGMRSPPVPAQQQE